MFTRYGPDVKLSHQINQYAEWQSYDIQVTTIDTLRRLKAWVLDTVCPCLVHRVTSSDVGSYLGFTIKTHQHGCDAACTMHLTLAIEEVTHGNARDDMVPATA